MRAHNQVENKKNQFDFQSTHSTNIANMANNQVEMNINTIKLNKVKN